MSSVSPILLYFKMKKICLENRQVQKLNLHGGKRALHFQEIGVPEHLQHEHQYRTAAFAREGFPRFVNRQLTLSLAIRIQSEHEKNKNQGCCTYPPFAIWTYQILQLQTR